MSEPADDPIHRRRPRYRGKNPRKFEDKYKEHDPDRFGATVAQVIASGKTPAGAHRPIMVREVLEALAPKPGEVAVDCTLGYGGHAREILARISPGGKLVGLEIDPIELPKTEARLRAAGFGTEIFSAHQSNFAGLPKVLAGCRLMGADLIVADLGVSSMQLDDPARGFSFKHRALLDMRMNPRRGESAATFLEKIEPAALSKLLSDNADEPYAKTLGDALAGGAFREASALATAVRSSLRDLILTEQDRSVRRVFQALRIAVNDEFSALEMFLRNLPACLNPGGRVGVLTFHSGEDRRVKRAFEGGLRDGLYAEISGEVIRPSAAERRSNPRSKSAKLRWAQRAASPS